MTDRLRRLLGVPDLAWLVGRARARLESGEPLAGTVTLTNASEEQRVALSGLLGRGFRPGRSLSVRLETVDTLLRTSGVCPEGLEAAVIVLTGPVTNRRDAAQEVLVRWDAAVEPLVRLAEHRPELAPWITQVLRAGTVKRLARDPDTARRLVDRTVSVLRALPSSGEALARFAARVLGDAHALDTGTGESTLVLSALRATNQEAGPSVLTAQLRRRLWSTVGVAMDELSSTVLVHCLPADSASASGVALARLRASGEPAVLTLRQLTGEDLFGTGLAGRTISVCENPSVVQAAAEELGSRSAPLVCVNGHPSAAAWRLLSSLDRAGATLRYHGDFDWGGVRIAGTLWRRLPMIPWRYGAADYRAAAERVSSVLAGAPAVASWDPELAPAMIEMGRRVEEERVVDQLLADLELPDLAPS